MNKRIRINVAFIWAAFISFQTSEAQQTDITQKLTYYNIPADFFDDNLSEENANHAFGYRTTSISTEDTTFTESTFDPTRPEGEKWVLVSLNGREPTEKEQKNFQKAHKNDKKESDDGIGEPKEEDMSVIEENEEHLIIGFRYRKENLPKKYKFLAQCQGKIFINRTEKRLEKIEYMNFEPVRIGLFKADKMDMVQYYVWEDKTQSYLVNKEEILMDVLVLGQVVEVKNINEFYSYKKVK